MSEVKSKEYDPANPEATGVILNEPNDTYHANAAISHSKLTDFINRPAYFKGKHIDKLIPNGNSEALKLGSAIHVLILEGEQAFHEQYASIDVKLNWRSKADKYDSVCVLNDNLLDPLDQSTLLEVATGKKEDIEAFFADRPGRILIEPHEKELCFRLRDSVLSHPVASVLLAQGMPEVTFRSEVLDFRGYAVQCRPDWLSLEGCEHSEGEAYCADLKTIAALPQWNSQFWKRGYHRALPFYEKTMEAVVGAPVTKKWFWIVVEKEYPWATMVYGPSPEVYERGMAELGHAMPALTHALQHDDFRDEGHDRINLAELPDWLLTTSTKPGFRTEEMV